MKSVNERRRNLEVRKRFLFYRFVYHDFIFCSVSALFIKFFEIKDFNELTSFIKFPLQFELQFFSTFSSLSLFFLRTLVLLILKYSPNSMNTIFLFFLFPFLFPLHHCPLLSYFPLSHRFLPAYFFSFFLLLCPPFYLFRHFEMGMYDFWSVRTWLQEGLISRVCLL